VFKRTRRSLFIAAVVVAAMMAIPAFAGAASYVSNSAPVVPGGKSCAQPGFSSIQSAINSGVSAVNVCSGTYTEQLEITKAVKLTAINGAGTATAVTPAAAFNESTSECDTKGGLKQIDGISICTSGTVSITGLNVETLIDLKNCGEGLNGIFVGGGGTLKATNLKINGASTTDPGFKGCQQGVAVNAGSASREEVGHAILKQVTVTGYQKNGPTVKFAGSSLSVISSTITGSGPNSDIAQNGVQISFGAVGSVKASTVSGNECNVASCGAKAEQAAGVLFYEAAPGSKLVTSKVDENDDGVYYFSGSATQPSSAEVTLTSDVFTNNRYEGVALDQGKAALKSDTVNGTGLVGVLLYQYAGQTLASESSAIGTKISGQSEASIKVESDKSPSDIPGKFTFSKGIAAEPVLINENPEKFEVTF
jgi:hypothetical protein